MPKETAMSKLSEIYVEFSPDDELIALVTANTYNKMPKAINAVLRCLTLIAGGTPLSTSCKLTGVSLSTLNRWRASEWYDRAMSIIQKRLDDQLDGKMTHILNKGIDRLHQRLDLGDPVVGKNGTISYKPVSAKDAAIISSIFFDKRNLLRNKPTTISSKVGTDERLQHLADKFKEIAIEADFEIIQEDTEEVNDVERIEAQTYEGDAKDSGRKLGKSFREESGANSDQNSKEDSKWVFNSNS